MTLKTAQRIRLIRGILTIASLTVAAVCLMAACLGIYRDGEFTRELVAERFAPISLPVYLAAGLSVLSLLSEPFLPKAANKPTVPGNPLRIRQRLERRADLSGDEALGRQLALLQDRQHKAVMLRAGVLALCAAVFLLYALNPAHFHDSAINGSMVQAMAVLAPCLAVAFLTALIARQLLLQLTHRQIALLKQAPAKAVKAEPAAPAGSRLGWVKPAVLALAAALLIYGYFTGGTTDVLTKAANICTECVGLG